MNQPSTEEQLQVFMQKALSALQTIALYKRPVKPHALMVAGGTSGSVPSGVKAFNIINLGNAAGVFVDIPVTGITGITAIPKELQVYGHTVEEDQNMLDAVITVSPPAGHRVLLQYNV